MNFILIIINLAIISKGIGIGFRNERRNFETDEQFFMKLFKLKRATQLEAVKSLKKSLSLEKQQSMINLMTEKIFSVIQDKRALLESLSYVPGMWPFPSDEKIRDGMSNILENTALFCEIVLRFPNMAPAILKKNNEWDVLLQWSITFSNLLEHLLDKSTVKLLHLASQELNYIERNSDYINPYREDQEENTVEAKQPIVESTKAKRKVKKKIKRGPKLVDFHSEL